MPTGRNFAEWVKFSDVFQGYKKARLDVNELNKQIVIKVKKATVLIRFLIKKIS